LFLFLKSSVLFSPILICFPCFIRKSPPKQIILNYWWIFINLVLMSCLRDHSTFVLFSYQHDSLANFDANTVNSEVSVTLVLFHVGY
jgi:hypothetical protein